jgi:hypothetical protein
MQAAAFQENFIQAYKFMELRKAVNLGAYEYFKNRT